MRVVVPYAVDQPKTRLSPVLSPGEREAFVEASCRDVLDAIRQAGETPELLATAPVDFATSTAVTVDEGPLSTAVNAVLAASVGSGERDDTVAVVMADLALATPESLRRLFTTDTDVVAAPGRGGGTNALVVRHSDFRVDYHGASIRDHRRLAREVGAEYAEVDSMRLATDIDEPDDLAELLLHGEGRATDWLREAGFELDVSDGRVGISR